MPSKLFTLEQIPSSLDIRKFYESSDSKIGNFWEFISDLGVELDSSKPDSTHVNTSVKFTQILFPLKKSELLEEDFNYLNLNPEFKQNLLVSLALMLQFYGAELNENDAGIKTINFTSEEKRNEPRDWKQAGNHHHARFARIIKSLQQFGLEDEANALGDFLDREKIIAKEVGITKLSEEEVVQKTAREIENEENEKASQLARFLLWQAMKKKDTLTVEERVKLRNRLIELVKSNDWGNQEDASEMFITPLFDHIFKQNHPIQFLTKINSVDGENVYSEKVQHLNKIELALVGEAKVSSYMLREEVARDLTGVNKYALEVEGQPTVMVDAKIGEKYTSSENDVFIALKRFAYSAQGEAVKLENSVELDDLNLNSSQEKDYEARAFIIHTGAHYIACVRDREGWWVYDDNKVEKIADDKINKFKEKAYIIKYSKKTSPLPAHQTFGTTNFDGLNNACWANASLALVLSSDNIENMLAAEFANQNVNFDAELKAIDKRIEEKAKIREQRQSEAMRSSQSEQQRLWAMHDKRKESFDDFPLPSQFMKSTSYFDNQPVQNDASLMVLSPSIDDSQRLYSEGQNQEIKLALQDGGKAIFSDFTEFAIEFYKQLNKEPGVKKLVEANDSIFSVIFPIAMDDESLVKLRKVAALPGVKEKFSFLLTEILGFYDLVMFQNEDKIQLFYKIGDDKSGWKEAGNYNHNRLNKIILSALSFGYYEYAKGIYEFLQREVDKKNPLIKISDETREYWSGRLYRTLLDCAIEVQPVKTVAQIKGESKAKRSRLAQSKEETTKSVSGKVTTNFVSKDVLEFPTIKAPLQDQELTIGDLHGNALKLLWILCYHDLIEVSEDDYEEFVSIYADDIENIVARDPDGKNAINDINEIIDRIKIKKDKNVLLRLMGDVFCDRGENDYYTARLLGHIKEKGLESEIIFSNHDEQFIKSFQIFQYELLSGEDNNAQNLANCLEHTFFTESEVNMGISMSNLETCLASGAIDQESYRKFYSIIKDQYLPQLKLVSYNLDKDGAITIFTHAPNGLNVIEAAAKQLGVEFKKTTAQDLADSIDRINVEFKKYMLGEVIANDGGFKSVFDLGRSSGDVDDMPGYDEASVGNFDNDAFTNHPFTFLIWARLSHMNSVYQQENLPYKIKFTFGHDNEGEILRDDAIFDETTKKNLEENLNNLDNAFCKDRNSKGKYSYQTSERRSKEKTSDKESLRPNNEIFLDMADALDKERAGQKRGHD